MGEISHHESAWLHELGEPQIDEDPHALAIPITGFVLVPRIDTFRLVCYVHHVQAVYSNPVVLHAPRTSLIRSMDFGMQKIRNDSGGMQ